MPSFVRNTSGGKAISGGALQPRGRRGNTNQVASYWSGGSSSVESLELLVIAGGGGGGPQFGGGGGGAGGYRENLAFAVSAGTGNSSTDISLYPNLYQLVVLLALLHLVLLPNVLQLHQSLLLVFYLLVYS